jgi:hypothetical protein
VIVRVGENIPNLKMETVFRPTPAVILDPNAFAFWDSGSKVFLEPGRHVVQ